MVLRCPYFVAGAVIVPFLPPIPHLVHLERMQTQLAPQPFEIKSHTVPPVHQARFQTHQQGRLIVRPVLVVMCVWEEQTLANRRPSRCIRGIFVLLASTVKQVVALRLHVQLGPILEILQAILFVLTAKIVQPTPSKISLRKLVAWLAEYHLFRMLDRPHAHVSDPIELTKRVMENVSASLDTNITMRLFKKVIATHRIAANQWSMIAVISLIKVETQLEVALILQAHQRAVTHAQEVAEALQVAQSRFANAKMLNIRIQFAERIAAQVPCNCKFRAPGISRCTIQ